MKNKAGKKRTDAQWYGNEDGGRQASKRNKVPKSKRSYFDQDDGNEEDFDLSMIKGRREYL
ncbi:hypothetical protein [Persicobacter psychrovividus]|uniref:Uncharacterized protein n=1 Tax=Persicobacter psychrovividus TaxID=387638 RepID=A0ABM7VFF3_9BACT|nr:hypothetical protein PEPS_19640 [Persicobacter psychrovividus]